MARTKTKGKAKVEKQSKALEKLVVVYAEVNSLSPNAYNPNRQSEHDFELLCRSIEEDGFTQPVIVRESDKVIVDGEHRWRAARQLGYDEIPIVLVDFTDEQMRISTLRHNRARGSEDLELSASVLRDLQALGAIEWAQDSLMIDDTELEMLLNDVSAPEAQGGEDFSGAWDPAMADMSEGDSEDGTSTISRTTAASDRQREIEKRIAEAKTEEERAQARSESDTFRVVAIFSGDEAAVVKRVIGRAGAANRLLAICTKLDEAGDHADG